MYVVGCSIWYLCPLYLLYKVVNIVGKNWQEKLSLITWRLLGGHSSSCGHFQRRAIVEKKIHYPTDLDCLLLGYEVVCENKTKDLLRRHLKPLDTFG